MAFGGRETLTGLFCWEANFGFALLLMDESRYCILHTDDVVEDYLGTMVRVEGTRLAGSVLGVEKIIPLGVRMVRGDCPPPTPPTRGRA